MASSLISETWHLCFIVGECSLTVLSQASVFFVFRPKASKPGPQSTAPSLHVLLQLLTKPLYYQSRRRTLCLCPTNTKIASSHDMSSYPFPELPMPSTFPFPLPRLYDDDHHTITPPSFPGTAAPPHLFWWKSGENEIRKARHVWETSHPIESTETNGNQRDRRVRRVVLCLTYATPPEG